MFTFTAAIHGLSYFAAFILSPVLRAALMKIGLDQTTITQITAIFVMSLSLLLAAIHELFSEHKFTVLYQFMLYLYGTSQLLLTMINLTTIPYPYYAFYFIILIMAEEVFSIISTIFIQEGDDLGYFGVLHCVTWKVLLLILTGILQACKSFSEFAAQVVGITLASLQTLQEPTTTATTTSDAPNEVSSPPPYSLHDTKSHIHRTITNQQEQV